MSTTPSFTDVMARLRAGEDEAATAVFNRFARRLVALARTHLEARVRQKVDPEDVVQSAYKSFFLRDADRQFDVCNWESLWSLLSVMVIRKCINQAHFFAAACRDLHREVTPDEGSGGWELLNREPSADEAAMLAETVERLMREVGEDNEQILALALQGFTTKEISEQLDRAQRSVQRVVERVKYRLQHPEELA